MNIGSILLIALGLSLDAFSVALASGAAVPALTAGYVLRIALAFGGFQAIMPVLGWAVGSGVRSLVEHWDHWLAFGLLAFIGLKMAWESRRPEKDAKKTDCNSLYVLFMLSVATSIDALAVGLSLSFLQVSIIGPALIIGSVTFLFSAGGVALGRYFGHFYGKKMELLGGLILLAIGLKILVQHLAQGV